MGVFARLFRRSSTTKEAQSAVTEAAQTTAGTEAEATDEAKGAAEAGTGSETVARETAPAGDDGVAIPRQQSAAEAAETEAEEGART
ncbi:hypothetical protein [Streptomyces glomeratus]|uniref:Gliding motility protein n=1 Tax=Streptomyces glomeratus TaxID=284452 RepID=A0ABP6LS07_9ACTN|nr:hypothetical protein [Streptomyces glomeratus]MCF1507520.1 hypothetical protein [Streptomyces glomeratus]